MLIFRAMQTDEQLVFEIIEAARAVHAVLGPRFVEAVYNKAFGIELRNRSLAVEREKIIRVLYGSVVVGRRLARFTAAGLKSAGLI